MQYSLIPKDITVYAAFPLFSLLKFRQTYLD